MKEVGKISEAELEVMRILWEEEAKSGALSGVASGEIVKRLQSDKAWDRSTIRTLLARLVEKGAVRTEKQAPAGRRQASFLYHAGISEEAYVKTQTRGFIDRLYGGSARDLVAALVDDRALSAADLAELRAFFDEAAAKEEAK